jgi:hypothetical protein
MGPEQQQTFKDLKAYLLQLPMLSSPEQGQLLIIYKFASHMAISGALVKEKEDTKNKKVRSSSF